MLSLWKKVIQILSPVVIVHNVDNIRDNFDRASPTQGRGRPYEKRGRPIGKPRYIADIHPY